MLRRGSDFVDGSDALGALMEHLEVAGSAVFAVPPGAADGEYALQALCG